jgi:hypothetical protein
MANDLATSTKTDLATRLSPPPLNSKLSGLLLGPDSPVVGPNTAAALREWYTAAEAHEAALELPDAGRIENMVSRLATATAFRKLSKDEAKEVHGLYRRALSDLPLVDLATAFDKLLRTSTFMPKPAEMRAEANLAGSKRRYPVSRARFLVWRHDTLWHPPVEVVTPEEMAEVRAQVAAKFQSERADVG